MNDNVTIPDRFPIVILDLLMYVLDMSLFIMMIQMEVEFEHELDLNRLRRAIRLAMDAEPILGCRLVTTPPKMHWRRLENLDDNILEVAEDDEQFSAFRHRRISALEGPQLAAAVLREGGHDRLLIKVSHVVTDAGGTKEVVGLIANIYNKLDSDPDYRPVPNCTGSRDISQVTKRIPWRAYPRILLNLIGAFIPNSLPSRIFSLDIGDGPPEDLHYVSSRLPKERVECIARRGKRYGASLNDMLLAALYRTATKFGNWDGQKKLCIGTTVDLRRWHMPEGQGEAITHLSSFELPNLVCNLGRSFDDTLNNVVRITGRRKRSWFGLNVIIPVQLLAAAPQNLMFRILKNMSSKMTTGEVSMPGFTNMGMIDTATVNFGKPPCRAWMLTPPSRLPSLAAGVTGYDGSLTLSAGAYPSSRTIIEKFFEEMIAQLPG